MDDEKKPTVEDLRDKLLAYAMREVPGVGDEPPSGFGGPSWYDAKHLHIKSALAIYEALAAHPLPTERNHTIRVSASTDQRSVAEACKAPAATSPPKGDDGPWDELAAVADLLGVPRDSSVSSTVEHLLRDEPAWRTARDRLHLRDDALRYRASGGPSYGWVVVAEAGASLKAGDVLVAHGVKSPRPIRVAETQFVYPNSLLTVVCTCPLELPPGKLLEGTGGVRFTVQRPLEQYLRHTAMRRAADVERDAGYAIEGPSHGWVVKALVSGTYVTGEKVTQEAVALPAGVYLHVAEKGRVEEGEMASVVCSTPVALQPGTVLRLNGVPAFVVVRPLTEGAQPDAQARALAFDVAD